MKVTIDISVLDRLLQAANITKDTELSKVLGLSSQAVSKARNSNKIPPAWIPEIALHFGVSTDWLFFGIEPMRIETATQPEAIALEQQDKQEVAFRASCMVCAGLVKELVEERLERREVTKENRQLWKTNAELREHAARLEEQIQKVCSPKDA